MPTHEHQRTLDRYYEAFNALDPDAITALFTPDCVFHDRALDRRNEGHAALREFVLFTSTTSPEFRLEPQQVLIDGDRAAVLLTMSGSFGEAGIPWSVPSTSFFSFRGDRIHHKEDVWNVADLMQQVGLGTMPTEADLEPVSTSPDRNERARALAARLWGIETLPESSDDGFLSPGLEHLFGEIWTRPGLALRDRSLVTVAALIVLAREQELRFHLRGALNAGLRPQELREVVLQLAYYGGYPTAAIARRALQEVLPTEDPS